MLYPKLVYIWLIIIVYPKLVYHWLIVMLYPKLVYNLGNKVRGFHELPTNNCIPRNV